MGPDTRAVTVSPYQRFATQRTRLNTTLIVSDNIPSSVERDEQAMVDALLLRRGVNFHVYADAWR